jgi:holin-like protein
MSLPFLTLLLSLQLVGEILHLAFGLSVPGPVIGMALLFAGLLIRGGAPPALEKTAFGLLENLSLLFVPAGVGVMLYLPLLATEWRSVLVALVGSTIAAIAVTGWVMVKLNRADSNEQPPEFPEPSP